ncbi:polysaccharide deacetylase [Natronorubrum sulfidifaciens JCM 14089]|uniref:Polysaccharide deacetylase n=1 Tax=Natronorubrum sulfidifaciens JCM 14089 TaxID=1230460 RepID=L9WJ29_9EURY|nr:polysaccharide deacetylase [Natronorubrum sulfidifaciens JCM 14089]
MLDDFEELSRWRTIGGTLSADEETYLGGSQAARLEAGTSDERAGIGRQFDQPIDLSDRTLSLAVRADDLIYPWIQLVDDDGNRMDLRTSVRGNFPFKQYDFGVESVTGSVDLTAITDLRIIEYVGESERTIWCDSLRVVDRPDTGAVMIQFDDGNVTDHTQARPILEQYGYQAVTFVNPGTIGTDGHLTLEQVSELHDAGWTVGSHSYDHVSLPAQDVSTQEDQIRESKEWLLDHGFEDGAEYFAYPYTDYDETTCSLVDEYYTLGFAGGFPAGGNVTNPLELHRLGDLNAADARDAIDAAVQWNGITQLFFHWLGGETLAEFEQTIEYLHEREQAGELDVISPAELEAAYMV